MRKRTLIAASVLILAAAIVLVWKLGRDRIPDGLVLVNGRIEGDPVVVASKVAGRLDALKVKEGDAAEEGDPIAEIGSDQIRAQVDQAAASKESMRGALDSAQATAEEARKDLARAQAVHAGAVALLYKYQVDLDRAKELLRKGVIPRSEFDTNVAEREVAKAGVDATQEQIAAAQRAVAAADAKVASTEKQVAAARAALDESRANFGDTQVQSPIKGVVMTKVAEQGEVLAAGSPIVVLVDLDHLHMKAYVPEPEIGRVKLGDPCRIYVDAFPDRPFSAFVGEISPRSEFTPKEVQTRDERVKQVFAVKLFLSANPQHMLVPGMPADAVIRWKPGTPWINPIRE